MNGQRESWLVTGALGCIGAWTVVTLIREGASVVAFDLGDDDHRLRLIARPEEIERAVFVRGDITELDVLERTIGDHHVTHVVHLAALQIPFCRENPPLGSRVNVTGTANVFEAVKRRELGSTVAYASSAAVYDEHGAIAPKTIYGVFKVANEGCARVYWQENRVASVGLRPLTVYGPGRDQGMTAGPTEAMAAAAKGAPYRIAFGGRTQLHYVADVAHAFITAARQPPDGAQVFNIGGPDASMAEIVATIMATVPGADVTFDDDPLPFLSRLPEPWFELPLTPLEQGIRETVETFTRV
jgi:UDP-glucuronate 4-epimerase